MATEKRLIPMYLGNCEETCLKIYSDGAVSAYAWQFRKPDDFCSYGERK